MLGFRDFEICKNMFVIDPGNLCLCLSILVLGLGDGFKNPEIMEMMLFGFSHRRIEKLLDQIDEKNFPEL